MCGWLCVAVQEEHLDQYVDEAIAAESKIIEELGDQSQTEAAIIIETGKRHDMAGWRHNWEYICTLEFLAADEEGANVVSERELGINFFESFPLW